MDIKLMILDVDGTLTDGRIYYGDGGIEIKAFSARDGAVIKPMRALGIEVVFLTGRCSYAVSRRAEDLNAASVQGIDDKYAALQKLLTDYHVSPVEAAYIGDDINDYAAMSLCGYKGCPSDAAQEIKSICDYISPYPGGGGAVRDICEHLLRKTGKYNSFLLRYGVCVPK